MLPPLQVTSTLLTRKVRPLANCPQFAPLRFALVWEQVAPLPRLPDEYPGPVNCVGLEHRPVHGAPAAPPHTFAVPPPPQVSGEVQLPQEVTVRV